MQAEQTISPLHVVPPATLAPVKPLLSPEEKNFLDLLADIFVKDLLRSHSPEDPLTIND